MRIRTEIDILNISHKKGKKDEKKWFSPKGQKGINESSINRGWLQG
jgi:hypothetical protein